MLNRSKFAVFVAVLLLLGALVPRPMAAVGSVSRDQQTSLQPNGLFLVLARPLDTAKLLPAKPHRDSAPPGLSDAALPTADEAPEPHQAGSSPAPAPATPQRAGTTPAAWPRGPPTPDPQQDQLFPENRSANRRA